MSAITMSTWDWVLLIVTIGSAVGVLFLVMIRKFSSHSYEDYEVQSALREVTRMKSSFASDDPPESPDKSDDDLRREIADIISGMEDYSIPQTLSSSGPSSKVYVGGKRPRLTQKITTRTVKQKMQPQTSVRLRHSIERSS